MGQFNLLEDTKLNSNITKKLDDLFDDYKKQSKDNLETLHYIIRNNFVNNKYTRASNNEIEYMWDLYKKEQR